MSISFNTIPYYCNKEPIFLLEKAKINIKVNGKLKLITKCYLERIIIIIVLIKKVKS